MVEIAYKRSCVTFYSNPVTMVDPFGLCPEKAAAAFKNALEDENFQKILIGTGFIIVGGVMIAVSGGTATPLVVAMGAGVVGTTATGAIIGYCENGKQGAIDGACDGYMVGGMFAPLMATGGLALEAKLTADLAAAYGGTSLAEGAQLVQKYNDRVASQTSYGKSSVKQKTGPKPQGTGAHNLKIEEIASQVTDGEVIAGGGRICDNPEAVWQTPNGLKKTRRPDILVKRNDGSLYGINVGKTTAKGAPIKREVEALYDLEDHGLPMFFVGYDK